MTKKILPTAAMEKIMKNVGAERVSEKSKDVLKTALEEIAETIAQNAVKLATHAGRKTVKARDIKLAVKT